MSGSIMIIMIIFDISSHADENLNPLIHKSCKF